MVAKVLKLQICQIPSESECNQNVTYCSSMICTVLCRVVPYQHPRGGERDEHEPQDGPLQGLWA